MFTVFISAASSFPSAHPPLFRIHENAEIEIIGKRCLRLALLLHSDKNNHPKLEFAFKLVYEVHAIARESQNVMKKSSQVQVHAIARENKKCDDKLEKRARKQLHAALDENSGENINAPPEHRGKSNSLDKGKDT